MFYPAKLKPCPNYRCSSGFIFAPELVPCRACTFTQRSPCYACSGQRLVKVSVKRICPRCGGARYVP
jgi:hypothetical protein